MGRGTGEFLKISEKFPGEVHFSPRCGILNRETGERSVAR